MKVLIVEDEPFAQQELIRLAKEIKPGIEILDCLDTVYDTVAWLNSNPSPDLLFLDIQLSDGLSFDIFSHHKISCPVIFTTAFDEYAIRAFKVNSIDYLLKPIKANDLEAAFQKLEEVKISYQENIDPLLDFSKLAQLLQPASKEYKSRFVSRVGDLIKHISVEDVAWFYAEDNVVLLVTRIDHRYIIDHTIDQLSMLVDPALFTRLNRGVIANIKSIAKVSKYFNGRLSIELLPACKEPVYVSRARAQGFIEWLDK